MTPTNDPLPDPARRRLLLAAALLPGLVLALPALARDMAAEKFIQEVGDRTVAVLNRPGASQEQRLDQLVQILNSATDLGLVGRLVLGQYWRTATEAQRSQYLEVFRALVVKTMADGLNRYTGQTFAITNSRAVDDRDTMVSTRIMQPAGQPIQVDWRVRKQDEQFQIIDIVAEGVSMVVTQRAEINEVVSQKGMDGLIVTLRQRLSGRA